MSFNSMTPVEVNNNVCANCVMHNWKQPEDKSSLEPCRRTTSLQEAGCGKILYCGRACRKEHWEKVHKYHCKYLADPSACPQSEHDAESCHDCRPPPGTGKGKRKVAVKDKKRNPASSRYECIAKDMDFAPSIASPHPFPVAGVEDDLFEKGINVTQKLVHKLRQNPQVAKVCSTELLKMEQVLWGIRLEIWGNRKILSHDKMNYCCDLLPIKDLLESVTAQVIQGKAGKEASEICKIIWVVIGLLQTIGLHHQLAQLDPSESMPQQFQDLVQQAVNNKIQFLSIAEEILDSLSTRVVSFEDIIQKFCGGRRKQNCSYCGVKIEVAGCLETSYDIWSFVMVNSLSIRKFCCGSEDCERQYHSNSDEMVKLCMAVITACAQSGAIRCDFCFKLCPIDKAHRCCNCLTVVYCSKVCHKKDQREHNEKYCIEDERKIKADRSMRRQIGEMAPGKVASAAAAELSMSEEYVTFLNETLEAFKFEESKSNPDTGREHDASTPAVTTVPTAADGGSKSGTGTANKDHAKDEEIPGAGATNSEHKHGNSASKVGAAGGSSINEVD